MKHKKNYYTRLDTLRILACLAVFLYHLGYLKGGYLAVCSFFVLSGYLSYQSAYQRENFSLKEYYKKRFEKIYIPFAVVVLFSIGVISLIPSINWLSLKPEVTSTLLGYNNFWQLKANLDYFARHADSPFMHFWYMGILLQFELIFPLFYLFLKKIEEKTKEYIPGIILGLITIISTLYFGYQCYTSNDLMVLYYHTLTRCFSLFLGVWIGWIHTHYHSLYFHHVDSRILLVLYSLLLKVFYFFIGNDSPYFMVSMILTTIITARMITYGTVASKEELKLFDKVQQYFSKISYEIYLFQYPILFIFQIIVLKEYIKTPLIILTTILLSMGLHFALQEEQRKKIHLYQILVIGIFTLVSCYGLNCYVLAEDHTEEMNLLKAQLTMNEQTIANKQEEYIQRLKQEEEQLNATLLEIEQNEAGLEEYVHHLPIIGVGDSVMLGAFACLYEQFPNGYFDAKVSRTDYEANRILQSIKSQGFLGDPIIINLGTNGQCGASCQYTILNTIENRKLFWINVVNDWSVHVNAGLNQLAQDNANVTVIDWAGISAGHDDYFVADGIHLTRTGCQEYARSIYQAIYQSYKNEIEQRKVQLLKDHEHSLNQKIAFYGKDNLINSYSSIEKEFSDYELEFHASFDNTTSHILEDIQEASKTSSFPKHIVLVLDSSMELSEEEIHTLEELNSNVYLITLDSTSYTGPIHLIDFSKEIQKYPDYLMVDKIHLSELGTQELLKILLTEIQK